MRNDYYMYFFLWNIMIDVLLTDNSCSLITKSVAIGDHDPKEVVFFSSFCAGNFKLYIRRQIHFHNWNTTRRHRSFYIIAQGCCETIRPGETIFIVDCDALKRRCIYTQLM